MQVKLGWLLGICMFGVRFNNGQSSKNWVSITWVGLTKSRVSQYGVSWYNPLKSFLTPLTVLVLSLKGKFLLSLLNIGLIRYSWSWNFLYIRPDIFECVSLILNKYWKALLLTFNFTIFLNPYKNQKDVCFHFLYLSLWVRGEDKVHNIQIKVKCWNSSAWVKF